MKVVGYVILITLVSIGCVAVGYFSSEAVVKAILGGLVGLIVLVWITATALSCR